MDKFGVHFLDVVTYRPPADNSIRLLLVLKGDVSVTVENAPAQRLLAGDFYPINGNENWQLSSAQENLVVIVNISPLWLSQHSDSAFEWRFSRENIAAHSVIARIRSLILHIVILWLKKNSDTWYLEVNKLLLEIFCILVHHFNAPSSTPYTGQYSNRINKAAALITDNYRQNITLQQIASCLHITPSHLSRQFTREVGVNFRTFLTQVRFRQAVKDIELTTRPIGQIISDNGFASQRRFARLFRQHYDTHPKAYRKTLRADSPVRPRHERLLPEGTQETRNVSSVELFSLLTHKPDRHSLTPNRPENLRAQNVLLRSTNSGTPLRQQRYVIDVGSFDELLKSHIQQQLITLKGCVPVFQVEVADPLAGDFAARYVYTDEKSPTWSPWGNLDLAISFIRQQNISPIIRICPFSSTLSFSEHLHWLKHFIWHNSLLLGQEYTQSWSFILDVTPDKHILPGEMDVRCRQLLSLIRQMLPGCQTGLSWNRGFDNEKYNQVLLSLELMQHIDFVGISVALNEDYVFGNNPESIPEESHYAIGQKLEILLRQLHKYGIHRPLYLQSWSTLTGNTLRINGLFFRGALLMNTLLSLPQEVVMLGLWLNSTLQNEVLASQFIETNSLSLFFSATTKRPVFHIIALKERLNGRVISAGPGWTATRHQEVYRILLLNTVAINPELSVQQHLLNDYSKRFSVRFELPEGGIWRTKQWVFDQKNGALYHQYGLHPTRYDRDEETMQYISRRSEPSLTVRDEHIGTHWTADIILDINAVCLLELRKVS